MATTGDAACTDLEPPRCAPGRRRCRLETGRPSYRVLTADDTPSSDV
ncbi:hypothetical protein [Natronolimnohabitans innermongolicus]|nr:hypothetical protein [Natronolimnohabitans innermongolicus]